MREADSRKSAIAGFRDKKLASLWIISFGDLLTLILCFFLSLISLGHIHYLEKRPQSSLSKGDQRRKELQLNEEKLIAADGTSIANIETGKLMFFLRLSEEDLADGEKHNSLAAVSELKREIESAGYIPEEAVVESCYRRATAGNGKNWFGSISRTLALRSQLIDAGLRPANVKLRSVGHYCESIGSDAEKEVVARLVIKAVREIHG